MHVNLGSALSAAGRHAEALSCYERAIEIQPGMSVAHRARGSTLMALDRAAAALESFAEAARLAPADDQAHNGMGVALERLKRPQEARACFAWAVALNPDNAEAHHNLGLLEASAGRHPQALASLERAAALQPRQPAVHTNRGIELLALGRLPEALGSFDRAIELDPMQSNAHFNRGLALFSLGRFAESLASFQQALRLVPNSALAHLWQGNALLKLSRPGEALASFDRALEYAPGNFAGHFQRGIALAELQRHAESVASFTQALASDPQSAEAFNNRGAVLMRLFRPADALAAFQQAVSLKADYADACTNAGNALKGMGRFIEALGSFDRALSIRADAATALWSKGVVKLALGELREGWPLYEARLRIEPARSLQRKFDRPRWTGEESIAGRTVLVHAEQGLGDTLQFCRYVPMLNDQGASVVLEVQPQLETLLRSLPLRGALIHRGAPLPAFDLHVPLSSLPLALRTDMDSLPAPVPYLRVEPAAVRVWGERLAALPGLRVGINWHGNPAAERFAALQSRSFPLAAAAPVADLPAVTLISLQKGAGAEQIGAVEFSRRVLQLTDPRHMGADELATETAAILMGLDVLVTADTALAHLAGALGVKVWVILQCVPDWRWLLGRADSPWYPTMRLFRQRSPGDWTEVLRRVATELATVRRN